MKLVPFIAALLLMLVLSTSILFAATVQPTFDPLVVEYTIPEWSEVGHDTCKVNLGCTATWAMNSFQDAGVLPSAIAVKARADFSQAEIDLAAGNTPTWQTYNVCHGDVVASSFSNREWKLITVPAIRATFPDCAPGLGWTYFDYKTGKTYQVFRVTECGNYTVKVVTPAVAGYVLTPLFATLVPHRSDLVLNNFTNISENPNPVSPAPVPLPASGLLLFFGLIVLSVAVHRLKTKRI